MVVRDPERPIRETLREKQSRFVRMVGELIEHADRLGFELTFGEAWRSPSEARRLGFAKSLHSERLAIDLNLFRAGVYLTTTEAHRELGEWWESHGGTWGGRFGDGNHYSLAHNGVK